jgi:hypothetical protein
MCAGNRKTEGFDMPRRRVDKVIEHRLSFSDFERQKINRLEQAAIANVALDAVTDVAKAAGMALGGGGALLAAFVLLRWKAPEIIADVTNATNNALDTVADVILPGSPVELRREAQRLAKERGEIAKAEATYCSYSSDKYDEVQCSQVQQRKDKYFQDLEAFRELANDSAWADLIYAGQDDIEPEGRKSKASGWNPLNWDWTSIGERL